MKITFNIFSSYYETLIVNENISKFNLNLILSFDTAKQPEPKKQQNARLYLFGLPLIDVRGFEGFYTQTVETSRNVGEIFSLHKNNLFPVFSIKFLFASS